MKKYVHSLLQEFNEIRFVASSLAFSTLLSIIPFFIIVLACFQAVGGLEEFYPKIEALLLSYLREATGSSISKYIRTLLENINFKALGISGGIFLVWTSLGLIRNMDYAINRIWQIKQTQPVYRRLWLYWLILLAVPIGLAAFIGLKSVILFNQSSRSFESQFLFSVWTSVFLFTIYKVIPDIRVRILPAAVSAVLAGASLWGVQKSFLWISLKVFRRNEIYGSLASFPIFLVWLLVVWYVVLAGVSLCAFLQQKLFKNP